MQLLADRVLVRPSKIQREGSLYILEEQKFPVWGEVLSIGPKVLEVTPGDLVLWEPVAVDQEASPVPYCAIHLMDEDGKKDLVLTRDTYLEPMKNTLRAFQRDSSYNPWVTAMDFRTDEEVRFLVSNVRKVEPARITSTGRLKVDYVDTKILTRWDPELQKLEDLYIFREPQLLGKLYHAEDPD